MRSLAFLIGLRFSRSRRASSFVSFSTVSSVIGIAVGVMALTIGLSAMNGFERELEERVLSVVPQVEVTTRYGFFNSWQKYGEFLKEQPAIRAVAPFVTVNALLERGKSFKAVRLKGIVPEDELHVVSVDRFITPGALETLSERGNVILGASIADRYGIGIGDRVSFLVSPRDAGHEKIAAARSRSFRVTGIFRMSGQLDALTGFVSLEDAREIAGLEEGQVEGISVRTESFLDASDIVLAKARQGERSVLVTSWKATQGHLYRDIQMVRLIVYIALFLVIAVACFNIVSGLMMSLNDKRQSVAILMTMGARKSLAAAIFVVMGMINGFIGVGAGLTFGFLVSWKLGEIFRFFEDLAGRRMFNTELHFIDFVPSEIHGADFVVAGCGALLICFFATIYPAYKAGRTMPAVELSRGK
ncbi:MAG: lipoprotein-releasing ABC transporter permease subunit [Succinivibrionaceae bacterium]|nr:lipoprotein-releasing ABC transporter permease subunit [Succinivibrionaceae bacterium]